MMISNRIVWLLTFNVILVLSQSSRDPWLWPFATDSIWNMPIGSNAIYKDAGLNYTHQLQGDTDYLYRVSSSDPLVEWYPVGDWSGPRCEIKKSAITQIPIPKDLIIPDVHQPGFTWNNAAAFLQPDNRTLIQMNPVARCEAGGPVYGYKTPHEIKQYEDLYGLGITGGHGGSGMSSIGGTIRVDEMLPTSGPIRHALKIEVYAHAYLYKNPPGFTWPALNADGYAYNHSDTKIFYNGDNPYMLMGALLAIPPSETVGSLQIQTVPGQKIFHALQDYGGYIVSDTTLYFYAVCVEQGVMEQFNTTYGYHFTTSSGDWYEDIVKIFGALKVVANNGPNSIGGGGTPRQPLAPPITPPN